jgi:hypothetical protein
MYAKVQYLTDGKKEVVHVQTIENFHPKNKVDFVFWTFFVFWTPDADLFSFADFMVECQEDPNKLIALDERQEFSESTTIIAGYYQARILYLQGMYILYLYLASL